MTMIRMGLGSLEGTVSSTSFFSNCSTALACTILGFCFD